MTDSKGFEPLPAYLARVSSLFFIYDFPMGYINLMISQWGILHC
jgi:hypothetical protein